jgi:single-stranded DNA-specific DHH superfamily exonuclease
MFSESTFSPQKLFISCPSAGIRMGLMQQDYDRIKDELVNCTRPLFFMHDDPDGLASYLLLRRFKGEGKGVLIKTTPRIHAGFLRRIQEFEPDKVFILDIAVVDQEFVDGAGVPVIWIDHHEPIKLKNVLYFNPRLIDKADNSPVSLMCYEVVKQDMWIAVVGIIGDWYLPSFTQEFHEKYPELMPEGMKTPDDVLFQTRLGILVLVFSFILKGRTSEVNQLVQTMIKIKEPQEILEETTKNGKMIHEKFKQVEEGYVKLLAAAEKIASDDEMLVFTYKHKQVSFSKDLANAILYKHPNKVVIIGREGDDDVKLSLRAKNLILLPKLKRALEEVDGFGGGHEHACGAVVKLNEFSKFIAALRRELGIKEPK